MELGERAASSEANLVLMGIEPTYPSEKYGYIIPESSAEVSKVSSFKEKPDVKTAEEYIAQGALWNGGVFAYKLKYVLDASEDAQLAYGLSRNTDAKDFKRSIEQGKKRELHVDKALEVADLTGSTSPGQILRVLKFRPGCATEFLCRCKYFQVERMLLNTERLREMVSFQTTALSFQVLLCINGCGTIFFGECEVIHFFKGDCIFIPADSAVIKIHGKAQFLKISC